MFLFTAEDHRRVATGELTVTYRLWKTSHVKPGSTYPAGFGGAYRIDDVTQVRAGDITKRDAWAAGSPDVASLLHHVGAHTKAKIAPSTKLFRVQLTFLPDAPEKPTLDVDEAVERIARLDRVAPRPWTRTALKLIEQNPRVVARELAREAGYERLDFKINIRKLKRLGLTLSHKIGYELTELGQAVLDRIEREPTTKATKATKATKPAKPAKPKAKARAKAATKRRAR